MSTTLINLSSRAAAVSITGTVLDGERVKVVLLYPIVAPPGWVRFTLSLAYGIQPDPALVVSSDFSRDGAYGSCSRLIDSKVAFTAVFAANDMLAVGDGPPGSCSSP